MPLFKAIYKKLSKKWHPQAVTVGRPVEMKELCEQISLISTVSAPDARAAIEAMGMVMVSFMNSGRSVHVDGLGTFYYTCQSNGKGADTEKEVTANLITGTRVRFVPETTRKGKVVSRPLVSNNLVWTNIKSVSALDGTGTSTPGTPGGGDTPGTGGNQGGSGSGTDFD